MPDKSKKEEKEEISNTDFKLEEVVSFFKMHEFLIILFSSIIILFLLVIFFGSSTEISKLQTCGDGSFYGSCSITKPYYCEQGVLVEKASVCSCSEKRDGDSCLTELQTKPKNMTLKYILDGEEKELEFTVYLGLVDHLSRLPREIFYESDEKPLRADFIFKKINEEEQRELLLPLVIKIQNLTNDKQEQARIAISLVQNIPFGFSNKTNNFFGQSVNYSRYPYEVLYDGAGICGEKSELLAFLLREIGYEVVIFYNQKENHESVGIKCPVEESYRKTGYCFVETTGPSIIADDSIEYVGGIKLESEPEVILVFRGESLGSDLQEYKDAKTMKKIREGKLIFFKNSKLEKLKERYGLVEEYNPA